MKETVHSLLEWSLQRHADREAIIAPGRRSMNYGELGRQLLRDHAFLRRAGFGAQARIGVAMPPGAEGLVAVAAVARSATCAHFDAELDSDSLARVMSAMRLDAVIVPAGSSSNAVGAARRLGVSVIDLSTSEDGAAGAYSLQTNSRRPAAVPDLPDPDDLALLWYTSGTTGVPKIVPYEQWRICFDVRKRVGRFEITSDDRCLVASTPASALTSRSCLLSNLAAGAAIIHAGDLSPEAILSAVESLAPTYLTAAPAIHSRMLELIRKRENPPDHRLRAIFSSFTEQSPQVRVGLERALGVPMVINYGMTEMGGIADTAKRPESAPHGSVGLPVIELIITDESGTVLGPGEQGEICVRGPEVMAGYEYPHAANADAFRDGWFRTGDCGFVDDRGYLHLAGRIKDVINRGGMKVSPAEVEFSLEGHPAVREAAAFARRHPTLGEDLCAAVVFEQGRNASEAELRRFVRHRLSASKVPTRIVTAANLPRNAAGKLQRTELAAFGDALLQQAWQAPTGPHEVQVAELFSRVLRVDDISRNDQFFDRGGDSLRAVELLEQLRQQFGVSLTMDTLLDNPSVEALAKNVAEALDNALRSTRTT